MITPKRVHSLCKEKISKVDHVIGQIDAMLALINISSWFGINAKRGT